MSQKYKRNHGPAWKEGRELGGRAWQLETSAVSRGVPKEGNKEGLRAVGSSGPAKLTDLGREFQG